MAPVRNAKIIFNQPLAGLPEPGKTTTYDTSSTIDLDAIPLSGGVLVKVLSLSVEPLTAGLMMGPNKPASIPLPAYQEGQPTFGFGVGKVLRSENEGFQKGDYIVSPVLEHAEYTIPTHLNFLQKIVPEPGLPPSVYIGAAGMPGQTAFYGWKEYSKAKKGETLFVSTAAGPVGSIILQLAKREGMKVIASAGTDEKVKLVKSLGADVAFNYKTTSVDEVLQKEGPIDVYWDNVGGSTLDAALGNAALHARFIECGMISQLTDQTGNGANMKNLANIVMRRIILSGFIGNDPFLLEHWEKEFNETIPKLLAKGELQYVEDRTVGLEHVTAGLAEVLVGKNMGKKIIVVSEE
ncbi:hypothetical protein D9758_012486 [Tetrapyrgos nigripes]|uniref:Enoyl reductase (ER) domain-containing protein n=1 Tax=Tetrapyrgos nigripes TaxID=182062 RepID=A0A8H5CYP1_9AGAR|nr:hypothetical protein D9758_012486 [Tetrapyrgos nigripes]